MKNSFSCLCVLLGLALGTEAFCEGKQKIKLEIPQATWQPIFFEAINSRAEEAGFRQLRAKRLDANGREVRVWIGFGVRPLEGIIIRREGGRSRAWHIPRARETEKRELEAPQDGWELLWKELADKGMYELPDGSTLSPHLAVLDGTSYVVEYMTADKYRTYCYDNPEDQVWPEGKRLLDIVHFMKAQLNLETRD